MEKVMCVRPDGDAFRCVTDVWVGVKYAERVCAGADI